MKPPLILVCASGLAREVAEAVRAAGERELVGFVDDDESRWGAIIDDLPVLGGLDVVLEGVDADLVLCAGKGSAREVLADRLTACGFSAERFGTVVHPSVTVPASCQVGAGSVLLAQTVLTASVTVGRHVVCMPHVTLTHDDVLEDYVTLCAGVTLGGGVRVERAAYVGMSACVREGLVVGADAVLGMGSVLLKDLPGHQTWAGGPAVRLFRSAFPVRPA